MVVLPPEAGASRGVTLAVAGKNLVFEPETIADTITHFEGILDKIAIVRQYNVRRLTGEPAALDFASRNAVLNLEVSAHSLMERLEEAANQVRAAIDNLQANGSAYLNSDVLGSAGRSV